MLMIELTRDRVRSLEHRAEELRTISEYMRDEGAKETFLQLAREYDEMAARRRRQLN